MFAGAGEDVPFPVAFDTMVCDVRMDGESILDSSVAVTAGGSDNGAVASVEGAAGSVDAGPAGAGAAGPPLVLNRSTAHALNKFQTDRE
jgi:hypothetical protein